MADGKAEGAGGAAGQTSDDATRLIDLKIAQRGD